MPNQISNRTTRAESIERLDRDYRNMLNDLYRNITYSTTTNTASIPQPVEETQCNLSDVITQPIYNPEPDSSSRVYDTGCPNVLEPCYSTDYINIRLKNIQEIYYNICRGMYNVGISEENVDLFLIELYRIDGYNLPIYGISKNKLKNILLTGDF